MISKLVYSSHQYAITEAERRFLLQQLPEELNTEEPFLRIIDLYITNTRLRLRRVESPTGETLALKLGQKYRPSNQETLHRTMTTIYLNEVEYETLATLDGSSLIKRRYPFTYAGYDTSIDVFEDHLSGLMLLEIQQQVEEDVNSIAVPEFAVREVTDELFFTGGELAKLTKEAFRRWLVSW